MSEKENIPSYTDVVEEDYEKYLEEEFIKLGLDKFSYHPIHRTGMNGFEEVATPKLIEKYLDRFTYPTPGMPGNFGFLENMCRNKNLTPEFLEKHIEKLIYCRHSWLSSPCMTYKVIEKLSGCKGCGPVEDYITYLITHELNTKDPILFEKVFKSICSHNPKRLIHLSDHPLLTPEMLMPYLGSVSYNADKLAVHPNFSHDKIKEINKWYDTHKGVRSQKIPIVPKKLPWDVFKREYTI